jgi:hypothetical protein
VAVLYMPEMDMPEAALLEAWHAWYGAHLDKLLAIPGFRSAQRFVCTTPHPAPYVAIYALDSADVLTSDAYLAKAGPASAGEWRARMTNWRRNLFAGVDDAPRVEQDGWLAVIDRETDDAPPLPARCQRLRPIGLDRSVAERGLLTGTRADAPPPPAHNIRVCRPLTPWLTQDRHRNQETSP